MKEIYTAREIAEVLGVVKSSVLRRADKEGWRYIPGRNKTKEYMLGALPADVQKALVANTDIAPALLPDLAPEAALAAAERLSSASLYNKDSSVGAWCGENMIGPEVIRDPRVGRIVKIVQEAQQVPKGWKKRKWVQAVAVKHNVSFQTVYRWLNKYEKKGLAGLKHTKSTKKQPKAWSPEALDWWIGLCLKREHRHIDKTRLYAILREEALRQGWRIGSRSSAYWWHKKRVTPQLLALQRGGVRALDNTLPPILRDYSDLNPFEILVGDQHRFDFWVVDDESGQVFRPEGYFWQDLRTRCFYGGALDTKYDAYLMGLALRMGLRIFGPFEQIYTDWGKPELSRYIMGILKDMRAVGLNIGKEVDIPGEIFKDGEVVNPMVLMPGTHRKAIVRNAKAKMMEGTFKALEGILRSVFRVPGQVKKLGGPKEENEIDQAEIEALAGAGKLLTFWEFVETVFRAMDYYNKDKPHRGVLREWAWKPKPKRATPMDCLRACHAEGWKPVRMSSETIDVIFLPRQTRAIDRGRIVFRNQYYEHEALVEIASGTRVEIRFDPLDRDWVAVFRDGEFLCLARPAEYSSMKDLDKAGRKIEEKARKRKGFIIEYRKLTSAVPDFLAYSQAPEASRAAAVISKEQRRKRKEIAERCRELTPEELGARVSTLESATQECRPIFSTARDRYRWLLDELYGGREPSEDDAAFMAEYEAGMDEDAKMYWEIYKEGIGLKRQGGAQR
ncbi:MAG: Mu transposase C-terminal domain-containing protein [Deltaproteobacteria bacterium]|nr:Mu transposase C-terminal domain-containing protein [Deltaproteobacteria bacterium]